MTPILLPNIPWCDRISAVVFWTCEPYDTPEIRTMTPRVYNDFKQAALVRIAAEIEEARR